LRAERWGFGHRFEALAPTHWQSVARGIDRFDGADARISAAFGLACQKFAIKYQIAVDATQ
jgi:hypothetical protein